MNYVFKIACKTALFALSIVLIIGCGTKSGDTEPSDKAKTESSGAKEKLPDGLTPEQAAKVVAKVGKRTITVGDVTRQINRLSPYIRRRWAAPEKRKEFLEKLIRVELLSQEAERLGLTEDPEVQRTVNQVMVRLMVKNDLEKDLFPTEIEEDVLKKEYEKERDKYHRPAQVRASHIVVKTKPEAEKLLAELKQKAGDTRNYRQKARELSLDEKTKDRGGDLGYFSKPDERRDDEPEVPGAVAEAAWKIEKVGDLLTEIVQTDKGFHVVKLTNKRAEMNRTFDSVKRMIENRLLREKRRETMEKFVADLKAKAKVELFPDNLSKLKVGEIPTNPHGAPPGSPGMGAPGKAGHPGGPLKKPAIPKKIKEKM
ncbi:MAG: hypothetical protein GY854_09915 [Deltaproteobacteria bacterium]|nr:hypothetical protein [Deltaproteobacteria bacterium]